MSDADRPRGIMIGSVEREPNPTIQLLLNSYAPVEEQWSGAQRWMALVQERVFRPVVEARDAPVESYLFSRLEGAMNVRRHRLNERAWRNLLEQTERGELAYLEVEHRAPAASMWVKIEFRVLPQYWLRLPLQLLPDGMVPTLQDDLVDALKTGATMIDAVTGYLAVDEVPCPYETVLGLMYKNSEQLNRWLRGYYWGNILTEGHIQALGGFDRVVAEAPCHQVEPVEVGRGNGLYLQLTDSLAEYSDDELRKLRSYLLPALPRGKLRSADRLDGYAMRVFEGTE